MTKIFRITTAALIVGCALNGWAADVSFFGVLKQMSFVQATNAAPELMPADGYGFQVFVDASGPDLITNATVEIPGGGSRTLEAEGSDSYSFHGAFNSASALNAAYGTGDYTLQFHSVNDGLSTAQLTMPADAYPPPPFITNYNAAQTISFSNDFTLHWSAFTGGTTNDFIQVEIRDNFGSKIFGSAENPGDPNALNGASTALFIPANTLSPGETYAAEIFFAKLVDSDDTSIPDAQGVLAFLARSTFSLRTTGTPTPLVLKPLGFASGQFQFSLTTQSNRSYQIEFSSTLTNWSSLVFVTATNSETIISDSFAPGSQRRFYRAYRN